MAAAEVRLFGELSAKARTGPVLIKGQNERRLLALLALRGGHSVSRRDIAEELWPDAESAVSSNRLRTTLAGLRRCFEEVDPVLADGPVLRLNAQDVETDVAQAKRLDKRRQFAGSQDEEAATLDRLLGILADELLSGWEEPWIQASRNHWSQVRQRARVRRAELALQAENHDLAIEHAESAAQTDPLDEGAWSVLLVARAKTGSGDDALRGFRAAHKLAAKALPGGFSPQLVALAASVRDGLYDPSADWPQLPAGMDGALLRGFLRLLQVDTTLAARFVTTDAFRLEMLRVPAPAVAFLESLLPKLPEGSPERTAVEIMALRVHSVLHNVDAVIAYGKVLLERNLDPVQLRLVLSQMSFAHFLVRNSEDAMDLIERALAVAEKHASPHHYQLTRADRALYLWHAGKDEQARQIFEEVYMAVKDLSPTQVSYAPAYLCGLIGTILLWRGEVREADTWLQRGYSMARVRRYVEQLHQIEPPLGLARARLGEVDKGGALVISGLAHFNRTGNTRAFASALDTMAEIFQLAGHPAGASMCLQAGTRLRERSKHTRSIAEDSFASRVEALLPAAAPPQSAHAPDDPRKLLERIVQHFYQ